MDITQGQHDAREKLLNNFDQEVVEKVRVQSPEVLDRFNDRLWLLTSHILQQHAEFSARDHSFTLVTNPFPGEPIHPGPYRMGQKSADENAYRAGHPLAQRVVALASDLRLLVDELNLQYTGSGKTIAVLQPLVGQAGWMRCERVTVNSLEPEDHLVCSGQTNGGAPLADECRRLLEVPGTIGGEVEAPESVAAGLERARADSKRPIMEALGEIGETAGSEEGRDAARRGLARIRPGEP